MLQQGVNFAAPLGVEIEQVEQLENDLRRVRRDCEVVEVLVDQRGELLDISGHDLALVALRDRHE